MKIVILDRQTLGDDLDISSAEAFGEVVVYSNTQPHEVSSRISDADVVFVNKVKLSQTNLADACNLKLICEAATGYDNIDVDYCRQNNIAVCNVPGYSVHSVAQVTVSMVLNLVNHLSCYTRYTSNGTYSNGSSANILTPVYHELYGKTWGVIGYGGIGSRVGDVARALGCNVIAHKRTPIDGVRCTDIATLVRESDVITVHLPLSNETRGIIDKHIIANMKPSAVVVNTSRGAVFDEEAICNAVAKGSIAGFGSDVYSHEPFNQDSPYYRIKDMDNVCLTPHMAWGAIEARERCFSEMLLNMQAFFDGKTRNRVEL